MIGRGWRFLRSLFGNPYFWGGLGVLVLVGVGFYLLLNVVLMPAVTRHGVSVTVPNVTNLRYEEAAALLARQDLRAERAVQRFDPSLPRDVVLDQSPGPDASVKPGRRVYLTINTGNVPMVRVPPVQDVSLREAIFRLNALGLRVGETTADTVPSFYPNTVTRQEPAAGDSLPEGAMVNLWYSTGPGDVWVAVPDVTGLTVAEAAELLLDEKLRHVVLGSEEGVEESEQVVRAQSREPGTRVRQGFEIRLYVGEAAPEEEPGAEPGAEPEAEQEAEQGPGPERDG